MRGGMMAIGLVGLLLLAAGKPALAGDNPDVERGTFYSEALRRSLPFYVYFPPGYQDGSQRYPVVYWLHGLAGNESSGVFIANFLHEAILAGDLPPMMMVFGTDGANARSRYKDVRNLFGETVIIDELIPYIDKNYRTIADRRARAIEGFSYGGLGAMFFASKHPDLFCSAVSTGGALDDRETYDLAAQNVEVLRDSVGILLIAGSLDFLTLEQNERFAAHLTHLGIPYDWELVQGAIHWYQPYYDRLGASTLAFHAMKFDLHDGG
jgi:enterochelin esterase-like enzyme